MPTGYQIKDQEAAYYLTFQIVFWIDIFQAALTFPFTSTTFSLSSEFNRGFAKTFG